MTDLVLDDSTVVVSAEALSVKAHDLQLSDDTRMTPGSANGVRRALVHDFQDGLTINWQHDYPGGVTVFGLTAVPVLSAHDKIALGVHGGAPAVEPVRVAEAILALQQQVQELRQQLTALSARVP